MEFCNLQLLVPRKILFPSDRKLVLVFEEKEMKLKVAPRILVTVLSFLFLFSACSLFESDKEKADRFVQLGMEAQKENKTDEAIIQFKNALQKDPLHSVAHYALGEIYFKADKPQLAAMELNLAINQDSKMTKAKQLLAKLYFRYGAYDRAIPLLKELAEGEKPDLETILMLGNALVNTEKGPRPRRFWKRRKEHIRTMWR
jgi:tetratricopeptide (TPR) repeat protein